MAELMKTDNWVCTKDPDGKKKTKKYVYVTKEKVAFVDTKHGKYYSQSEKFKHKTDWLYVECYENYTIDHMYGPHNG